MAKESMGAGGSSGAGVVFSKGNKTRRFTIRQAETDEITRGSDRKEVGRMLPASTAIINVYELIDKRSRTSKAGKRIAAGGVPKSTGPVASASGAGGKRPMGRVASGKSHLYPDRDVDQFNSLIGLSGESESHYREAESKHRDYERKLKRAAEEAEIAGAKNLGEQMKEAEQQAKRKVAQASASSDKKELLDRMKKLRIPYTNKVVQDGRYRQISIADPENIPVINKAIDNAVRDGRLDDLPKPIISVGSSLTSPLTTHDIYVLKDLSVTRKKKPMYSKAKRPMKSGKKRKIVMKKKGGKR